MKIASAALNPAASLHNGERAKMTFQDQVDPLFTIFEQHLYNFQDSDIDRKAFIGNVVQEYLNYLRKLGISVPKPLESGIVEELAIQVRSMLVKKIYGCLSISDYQKKQQGKVRRRVKSRYAQLQKSASNRSAPPSKKPSKGQAGVSNEDRAGKPVTRRS